MFEARISVVTVLEGRVGVALDVGSMFREKGVLFISFKET